MKTPWSPGPSGPGQSPGPEGPGLHLIVVVHLIVLVLAAAVSLHSAQSLSVSSLLDQYLKGDHDAVVKTLEGLPNFDDVLEQLKKDGPAWIAAADSANRDRRELTAATFALEAARIGAPREWKSFNPLIPSSDPDPRLQRVMPDCQSGAKPRWFVWKAPPLLIKWGFDIFAARSAPRPIERWWQYAAMSVAERAGDFEFLSSDGLDCLYNPQDEIDFALQVRKRFPSDPHLALAEAIGEEWHRPAKAIEKLEPLEKDIDVGAEATLRRGWTFAKPGSSHNEKRALENLTRVESMTRDPFLLGLARDMKAQVVEKRTPADPPGYRAADDRFWPQLIYVLRREIQRTWPETRVSVPDAVSYTRGSAARRDAIATLEAAEAGLQRSRIATGRLLDAYDTLIRHPFAPDEFECTWYRAEVALVQGVIQPAMARHYVERALLRCPDEPRLSLAEAMIADQRWPLGTTNTGDVELTVPMRPPPDHAADVTRLYEKAMEYPETDAEARFRLAWFLYRTGAYDRAIALVTSLDARTTDRGVKYLGQLVRGHALEARGQIDEAASAFQTAQSHWPNAQSARIALMTLKATHGDPTGAAALSESVQTAPADLFDPWWIYWQGDARLFTPVMEKLRAMPR